MNQSPHIKTIHDQSLRDTEVMGKRIKEGQGTSVIPHFCRYYYVILLFSSLMWFQSSESGNNFHPRSLWELCHVNVVHVTCVSLHCMISCHLLMTIYNAMNCGKNSVRLTHIPTRSRPCVLLLGVTDINGTSEECYKKKTAWFIKPAWSRREREGLGGCLRLCLCVCPCVKREGDGKSGISLAAWL